MESVRFSHGAHPFARLPAPHAVPCSAPWTLEALHAACVRHRRSRAVGRLCDLECVLIANYQRCSWRILSRRLLYAPAAIAQGSARHADSLDHGPQRARGTPRGSRLAHPLSLDHHHGSGPGRIRLRHRTITQRTRAAGRAQFRVPVWSRPLPRQPARPRGHQGHPAEARHRQRQALGVQQPGDGPRGCRRKSR